MINTKAAMKVVKKEPPKGSVVVMCATANILSPVATQKTVASAVSLTASKTDPTAAIATTVK